MLTYKISKKYSKGPEQEIAKFNSIADAKSYIQQKLQEDISMRVVAEYLLYDTGELMETFDQSGAAGSIGQGSTGAGSSAGQGGGQQQSSSFRPSPLQTSPRPGGLPPSSFKNEDDDKAK